MKSHSELEQNLAKNCKRNRISHFLQTKSTLDLSAPAGC
jgi:hypothetical protein